jgi:DNA ligase-1
MNKVLNMLLWIIFLLVSLFSFDVCAENTPPELILAKVYKGDVDLSQYWVSEKLDGVRAYWDGAQLVSRQGNVFPAPDWFVKNFPDHALDGELWLGRGKFQQLLSIVSKSKAIGKEWQQIKYFVFDQPNLKNPFPPRLTKLEQLVRHKKRHYLKVVKK